MLPDITRRLLVAAALLLSTVPAQAACLASAADVWIDQPGSHATWHYRHGQKCWQAGYPDRHQKTKSHLARVPVPRTRPAKPLEIRYFSRVFAFQGVMLADELLGRQKFVDALTDTDNYETRGVPEWWPWPSN